MTAGRFRVIFITLPTCSASTEGGSELLQLLELYRLSYNMKFVIPLYELLDYGPLYNLVIWNVDAKWLATMSYPVWETISDFFIVNVLVILLKRSVVDMVKR